MRGADRGWLFRSVFTARHLRRSSSTPATSLLCDIYYLRSTGNPAKMFNIPPALKNCELIFIANVKQTSARLLLFSEGPCDANPRRAR